MYQYTGGISFLTWTQREFNKQYHSGKQGYDGVMTRS